MTILGNCQVSLREACTMLEKTLDDLEALRLSNEKFNQTHRLVQTHSYRSRSEINRRESTLIDNLSRKHHELEQIVIEAIENFRKDKINLDQKVNELMNEDVTTELSLKAEKLAKLGQLEELLAKLQEKEQETSNLLDYQTILEENMQRQVELGKQVQDLKSTLEFLSKGNLQNSWVLDFESQSSLNVLDKNIEFMSRIPVDSNRLELFNRVCDRLISELNEQMKVKFAKDQTIIPRLQSLIKFFYPNLNGMAMARIIEGLDPIDISKKAEALETLGRLGYE